MFDREALADLHGMMREWLADHGAPQSVTEAEELAWQVAQTEGTAMVDQTLSGLAGRASYEGTRRGCACGEQAEFMGYRRRGVGTLYGVVEVQRASSISARPAAGGWCLGIGARGSPSGCGPRGSRK